MSFQWYIILLQYVLDIEIQLVLDAKKPKSPRMCFLLEENRNVLNHSMTLEKNVQSCKTFNVYLKVRYMDIFLFFILSY